MVGFQNRREPTHFSFDLRKTQSISSDLAEWLERLTVNAVVATIMGTTPEPVLLNVYGAPELIPRNEFRQPM